MNLLEYQAIDTLMHYGVFLLIGLMFLGKILNLSGYNRLVKPLKILIVIVIVIGLVYPQFSRNYEGTYDVVGNYDNKVTVLIGDTEVDILPPVTDSRKIARILKTADSVELTRVEETSGYTAIFYMHYTYFNDKKRTLEAVKLDLHTAPSGKLSETIRILEGE